MLVDTHCHIHESQYGLPVEDVLHRAKESDVRKLIVVGTDERSSIDAVDFAKKHENVFASVGVHPHEAKEGYGKIAKLAKADAVAVGEIGLDYYYNHSPRDIQIKALEGQIQIALDNNLPIIFHVREAFDDFWPVIDNFHGIRGVLHSFTDNQVNLDEAFSRGLYVGINGISTFTKDLAQQELYKNIPLDKILFETDAPFLTPKPFRGTINEPAYVRRIAEFHAEIRGIELGQIAKASSVNAQNLFSI